MSSKDIEYLRNYKTDTLYIGSENENGKYVTLVAIDISPRIKLALKAFYVNEKEDISGLKLTKISNGNEQESVSFSTMTLKKIEAFCKALQEIDLKETSSTKLKFSPDIDFDLEQIKEIFDKKPNLDDVYALAKKKEALGQFASMLHNDNTSEQEWQGFFENNSWIFGHGLNYIFTDNVGDKLEQTIKGHDFNSSGKRVDALMKTRAEISQYVLVEIKKASTALLGTQYRSGCWQASDEVTGAIAQIQKTCHEFIQNRFQDEITDSNGDRTGDVVYAIQPKSYLVVGNLKELSQNNDKFVSFELFRKSISSPEIITFDELYERAKCIIDNLGGRRNEEQSEDVEMIDVEFEDTTIPDIEDEIPF